MKEQITKSIEQVFFSWGYDRVETPSVEHLDLFAGSHFSVENMFKIIDRNGRILVLRPDITLPIARLVATKLEGAVQRLFYTGEVFNLLGKKETTQSGIEFIGDDSVYADSEVVIIALETRKAAGLKNAQIELGQVEFFKGLMEETGLEPEQIEALRKMADQKDMLGVEMLLNTLSVSDKTRENLLRLPKLFGGKEVLDEAERMSDHPRCLQAVNNLRQVWELLAEYGLEEHISIDLGMLHSIDYYTGLVFRGLSDGIGTPLLSGGRYDKLLSEFDYHAAATGFGVDIAKILLALESLGELNCDLDTGMGITYEEGCCLAAFQLAEKLRGEGKRVTVVHGAEKQEKTFTEQLYVGKNGVEQRG